MIFDPITLFSLVSRLATEMIHLCPVPRLPGFWFAFYWDLERSQGDTMKDVSLCVYSCFLVTMGNRCARAQWKGSVTDWPVDSVLCLGPWRPCSVRGV